MQAAIEEVRLPKSVVPVLYTLHYEDIDLVRWTFSGHVDIDLDVKEETDFIMLNAKELNIHSASLKIDDEEKEIEKFLVLKKDQRVVFQLDEKLKIGKVTLHVVFSGFLNDYLQGFYRSKYTVDGVEKYMATTQFESTDARMAFPCWDEPAVKARFRIFLTTPLNYTAVSNMPVIKKTIVEDHGVKKTLFEFAETPIMSTYLVAFVVGEFDMISDFSKNGVQVTCFTPIGKTEWGRFALKVGLYAINYYAEFFQVPYPLKKLDLLPIPDFAAGAMENWGCVTFREVDLLIDERTASLANKQRVAVVVAHEIAHMWFGDLVTMEWWTHLWLNEGFATYMENLCVDSLFPEWEMPIAFYSDSLCSAYYNDSFTSTHPIEVPVKYPEEVDQIFDTISYNKGSSVIHMLVSHIGMDAFKKGMKIYLDRHCYQNTCTEDLWRALGEGSGKDCEGIMQKWTQEPNYPMLILEEKDGQIHSRQQVFFSNPSEPVKPSDWKIPLAIITPEGTQHVLYENEKSAEFDNLITTLKSTQKWVKINQYTLCVVQYPESMWSALKQGVRNREVNALDRIQLLLDMKRLCNAERVKPSDVLSFLESFKGEEEWSVLEFVASMLSTLYSYVDEKDEELKQKYQAFAYDLLYPAYAKCGWDPIEGEGAFLTSARPVLLSCLCTVCEVKEVREEALRRFDLLMKKGDETACHTEIRLLCMREGVKRGDEPSVQATVNALMEKHNTTTGAEKRRIISAVGQAQHPSILQRVLNFTLDGTVRKQDSYASFAAVARNKTHCKLCWNYLKENLLKLQESLKGSFNMMGYFVEAGGAVLDEEEEYKDFKEFFGKPENNLKGVDRSILIAEQDILANIAKKKYMTKYLKEYFHE